jgi:hypothetical protein
MLQWRARLGGPCTRGDVVSRLFIEKNYIIQVMSSNLNLPDWNWTAYYESYSIGYFDAALLFEDKAQRIEQENETPDDLSKVNLSAADNLFSYIAGSIFLTTACLSAAIDEVFRDAVRLEKDPNAQTNLNHLDSGVVKAMGKACKTKAIKLSKYRDLDKLLEDTKPRPCNPCAKDPKTMCLPSYERWFLLDKFQLALYLASGKPFNLGDDVWKNAVCLRKLRNYLVHYKPEWIRYKRSNASYHAKDKTKGVMKCLKDRGFKNKLFPDDPWLHEGRLKVRMGADCAEWAVKSSSDFLYEFYERMRIDDLKNSMRDRWTYKIGSY